MPSFKVPLMYRSTCFIAVQCENAGFAENLERYEIAWDKSGLVPSIVYIRQPIA